MNIIGRIIVLSFILLGGIFFVMAPTLMRVGISMDEASFRQLASVFFIESSRPEVLKQTVVEAPITNKKLRILVVPGHDDEFWGTQYKHVKEADMTLQLGKELNKFLSTNSSFDVIMARDDAGYNPVLADYFSTRKQEILDYAHSKKRIMLDLMDAGKVARSDGVAHNNAPSPVVVRLYGINKWANENNVDLVVHIHFNDYPRKKSKIPGDYSGFSVYVPERQYSNARASKDIAFAVSKRLKTYYQESNMPKENTGVVEDQDLIAIGSFNSLDPASILIEYGYVYEPQFLDSTIRSKVISDMAAQTYFGIHNFFSEQKSTLEGKYSTVFLPHTWKESVASGAQHHPAILSLQAALTLEGVYPPKELDPRTCPIAGTYGKCTRLSLALFQKKYDIPGESGKLGTKTIQKLNELYSE